MKIATNIYHLHHLLHQYVGEITASERKLRIFLPTIMVKDTCDQLRISVHQYLDTINSNIADLHWVCSLGHIDPCAVDGSVMDSFLAGAEAKLSCCASQEVRDVCLLSSLQTITHIKISLYGTLAAFAATLGLERAGMFFHRARTEEKNLDERLSYLAEHSINRRSITPEP